MPARFHAPDASVTGAEIPLPDQEATHASRVLRLSQGDPIRVFDGRGHEWEAVIGRIAKRAVTVVLRQEVEPAPEAAVSIGLAMSTLKSDKMDEVVRDAVMLGVRWVRPLVTARTETTQAAIRKGRRVARWQRIAVASSKQCGRAVVPTVFDAVSFADALAAPPDGMRIMLVEPGGGHRRRGPFGELVRVPAVELWVGPEGGWTPEEVEQAGDVGVRPVTFGRVTLRADAAPSVALTVLRTLWNDW
ncbi:MAG: 16S rRNA (uracil(1498)-N(3))-methyltransferase [Acidobacteriota bacterium]